MTQKTRDPATGDFEHALRALAADDRHVRVPPHVRSAVMQAWDASMPSVRPRRVARRRLWTALIAGTAAAGAVVASLSVSRSGPDATPVDAAPVTATDQPRVTRDEAPHDAEESVVKQPPRTRRRPRGAAAMPTARTEIGIVLVADPVLDASALSVVRVRMPRSALPHLGIPIADPDATGSVDLEVLMGEDGIARTIRRALPVTGSDPQE